MLINLVILLAIILAMIIYLYSRTGRRVRLAERMRTEVKRRVNQPSGAPWRYRSLTRRLMRLLQPVGRITPLFSLAQRTEIAQRLVSAGFRSQQALVTVVALALLSGIIFLVMVMTFVCPWLSEYSSYSILLCLLAFYIGTLLPRIVLDRLVLRRQRLVQLGLPDALDLLVICTNAGLGLNSAIQRVAEEMALVCPPLSDELRLTSGELQISNDTEIVLKRLSQRTQLESVNTLVNTLLQSRQYGTAITQALRILARSERTARMMRLEEQAAKLAVKITVPMMLFILPTVLIVAAGPAVLGLITFFSTQH